MIRKLLILVCFISPGRAYGTQILLHGTSQGMDYRVEQLVDGPGIIWGMAFLSAEHLILTQRDGAVSLLNIRNLHITELKGAPDVFAFGQGGMLDVAVQKNHKPDDWIYFTYSKADFDQAATTVARARLDGDQLTDWQDLLITQSASDSGYHFGSRIAFDTGGRLFVSIGDRGHRPNGQNLGNHAGSILRLNLDGGIPADNPFLKQEHALPEIWSFGHRNPQGLAYDDSQHILWAIEHGPRGGDEINLIEAGKNYGWPVISHGKEYTSPRPVGEGTAKPGMEQPVKVYIPSIAPGSLLLYTGDAFPGWRGDLFSGALKLRHLNRVVLDHNRPVAEERLLGRLNERIRSLAMSPEGWIYVGTDSGKVLRVIPDPKPRAQE